MTLLKFNQPKTYANILDDVFTAQPWNKLFKDEVLSSDFFGTYPPVNIYETKEGYSIDLVVPGHDKADFKLQVEKNTLSVSAEKKAETRSEAEKQLRREFGFRAFKRSFSLAENVDAENINAKYENGILKITLPKKEKQQEESKQIVVS